MKRKVGLPGLVFVLLLQLVQGSAVPPVSAAVRSSAPPALPVYAPPSVPAQPALGLSDLAIAVAREDALAWTLPPHHLFALPGRTEEPSLTPVGVLPSFAQGTNDNGLALLQVTDAKLRRRTHTYFVPFDDENLWALFIGKAQCHGDHYPCAPLVSKVFITAGADGTIWYYDHWEDEYEADPLNPVQDSTEQGVLDAGATKVFESAIDPAAIGPDSRYYDGGDRITIVGEDANFVRMANPSGYSQGGEGRCSPPPANSSGWLAAAWEVLEVADWGQDYHATVGEDLGYDGQGNRDSDADHDYAGLEIMAWQDDTTVYYTGRLSGTLRAGETYFVPGQGSWVVGGDGVNSTDNITATKPVQVQMMTGACGRDARELVSAHGYTLVPVRSWSNEYWAPVPGFVDNPLAARDIDTDIYLHNPDPDNPITVTVASGLAPPLALPIPPDTTISVLRETGWDDLAAENQGSYLSSDGIFWGVAVIDSSTEGDGASDDWDWGYSLVPKSKLSSQLVVGYAPGKPVQEPADIPEDNGNLAFVVATGNTRIYVDLDQDGLPDPFDIDGDGQLGGTNVFGEDKWDECASGAGIPVQKGQVLRVGDPVDRNLQGARVYTGGLRDHIAAAWGQDAKRTDDLDYLDLGYTLLPLSVPRVSKTDGRATDADGNSVGYVPGDMITYTIVLDNNGMGSMSEVVLTDTLPLPDHSDFVVNSLEITTPPPTDTVEYFYQNDWDPAPSSDAERLRIRWDKIEPQQKVTITLSVAVHTAITVPNDISLCNHVVVSSLSTDPVSDTICGPVLGPQLGIAKTVVPDRVEPGGEITYTVVVSNYGNGVAWPTLISDVLPPGVQYVDDSLSLEWPIVRAETVTYTSFVSSSFRGTYADDFDLDGREGTTNYGGDDGSLKWTTAWSEINDDGSSASGRVQVRVDRDRALSEPAYVRLSAGTGLTRTVSLSDFYSPMLRYYISATLSGSPGNAYRVAAVAGRVLPAAVIGAEPAIPYDGGYCIQTLDLSAFAGESDVTLGWMADSGMQAGAAYHLDNVSIHEADSERDDVRVEEPRITTTIEYTRTLLAPLWYTATTPSHEMVFAEGLRLPPRTAVTATFRARVDDDVDIPLRGSLLLTNTAWVTATNWLTGPLRAEAIISLLGPPIDKSVEPDRPVKSGSVLTYTLTYANEGDEDFQRVFITDTLPLSVTFGGVVTQPGGWSNPPAHDRGPPETLTWYTPTLAVGARGRLIYTVTISPGYVGTISNTACISASMAVAGGVYECASTSKDVVDFLDLAIRKAYAPPAGTPYEHGQTLTYTLTYENHGPSDGQEVYITDTLPVSVTYRGTVSQPAGWSDPPVYVPGLPATLTWYTPTLAAGAGGQIVYTATITDPIDWPEPPERQEIWLINRACITNVIPETNYKNNCTETPTAVQLLYFYALRLPHGVLLNWETAWEADSYGFALLRSGSGRLADAQEIAFVPAAGSGGGGAAYRYLDDGIESDTSYTYWLVEVDTSGQRTTFALAVAAAAPELPYRIYLPFFWRP